MGIKFALAGLNIFLCLITPLAALIFLFITKNKAAAKAVLLGAATFFVSQLLLRLPLLAMLSKTIWWGAFQWQHAVIAHVALAFSAGVFEECGRYLTMKLFMKKSLTQKQALLFGAGHGGLEAVVFVGLNNLALLVLNQTILLQAASFNIFAAGLERISAVLLHMALSMLIMQAVKNNKIILLPISIFIHGLFNCIPLLSGNILVIELILLIAALLCFFIIYKKTTDEKKETQNEKIG